MNGMVRLILVRHGEAVASTDMRYLGSPDDPLTDRGVWQAAQLGQALALLPLRAIYASPLRRTADTAAAIAQAYGLPVTSEPRLAEAAMGTWEGLRRSEIIVRSPDDAEQHHRWEGDPACAPPGGESLASVQTRVLECVGDLAARHDGPIKALCCAALGARRGGLVQPSMSCPIASSSLLPLRSPRSLPLRQALPVRCRLGVGQQVLRRRADPFEEDRAQWSPRPPLLARSHRRTGHRRDIPP